MSIIGAIIVPTVGRGQECEVQSTIDAYSAGAWDGRRMSVQTTPPLWV